MLLDAVFTSSWPFVRLKEVDWEVELAFVIGRRGKHIKVSITASMKAAVPSSCSDLISTPLSIRRKTLSPTWPGSPWPMTSALVTGR